MWGGTGYGVRKKSKDGRMKRRSRKRGQTMNREKREELVIKG